VVQSLVLGRTIDIGNVFGSENLSKQKSTILSSPVAPVYNGLVLQNDCDTSVRYGLDGRIRLI
jgi:hypothetical protein